LENVLALPLNQLDIGISKRVISLPSKASVLDAMKLMHEQGVGSIAVIDTEGSLLSVCAKHPLQPYPKLHLKTIVSDRLYR
jgi:CBS domain-containing protein